MKKLVIIIGLLTFGTGVFAQQFFIDGSVATDFTGITPTVGMGVALNSIDVLAGIHFYFADSETEYNVSSSKSSGNEHFAGIYAGIAPKVASVEKCTFSFPILAQLRFGGLELENNSSSNLLNRDLFGIDFLAGVRAAYLLSDRWDVYAGFTFDVFKYSKYEDTYPAYTSTITNTEWFTGGMVQLGIIFWL